MRKILFVVQDKKKVSYRTFVHPSSFPGVTGKLVLVTLLFHPGNVNKAVEL